MEWVLLEQDERMVLAAAGKRDVDRDKEFGRDG
jgi:hypothetical protein